MEQRKTSVIPPDRVASRRTAPPGFRRGMALLWVALLGFLLIGLVGLSLDWGKAAFNANQLQNAADAAALAGAQIVKSDPNGAIDLAHEWAEKNFTDRLPVMLRTTVQPEPFDGNESGLDIILGRWIVQNRTFFATRNTPNAVKVIGRREKGLEPPDPNEGPVPLIFGPAFGTSTANLRCPAIGWSFDSSGAGLIVLDRDPRDEKGKRIPGLHIGGGGNGGGITVRNGGIHVNATGTGTRTDAAVYLNNLNNCDILCGQMTLTGRTDPRPLPTSNWTNIWQDEFGVESPYPIVEGTPYKPDPLAGLTPPDVGSMPVRTFDAATTPVLSPGYYPDGIRITSTSHVLNPGVYAVGGGHSSSSKQFEGLIATGGSLTGHGVTIYLTKDFVHAGGKYAQLNVGGNLIADLRPPGDYMVGPDGKPIKDGVEGITLWQDPLDTNLAELSGGSGLMISGTLYFPKNRVHLSGNPGKAGNQILCGSLSVDGNAEVVVNYDGRNDSSSRTAVLVE